MSKNSKYDLCTGLVGFSTLKLCYKVMYTTFTKKMLLEAYKCLFSENPSSLFIVLILQFLENDMFSIKIDPCM